MKDKERIAGSDNDDEFFNVFLKTSINWLPCFVITLVPVRLMCPILNENMLIEYGVLILELAPIIVSMLFFILEELIGIPAFVLHKCKRLQRLVHWLAMILLKSSPFYALIGLIMYLSVAIINTFII